MKIESINLSKTELVSTLSVLTSKFNTEDKKQTINFESNFKTSLGQYLTFDIESTLELYTEYPETDENNQTAISYRSVSKFDITFFYNGEEIKVNSDNIHELINEYYEI